MACYYPLQAFSLIGYKTQLGKSFIVFKRPRFSNYEEIKLPCGRCIGCRLERSRQWAIRCVHESRLYDRNCFISLTFSDDYLLKRTNPHTVDVRDFQLFIKRLRKRFGPDIRYFHCGEYGEQYLRPHYHACLFNFDFDDKVLWQVKNEYPLYVSETLTQLWPFGFSTIGSLTFHSAAYVARYIMKKVNGDLSFNHYNVFDSVTGEVFLTRKPEYVTMSRRPGIGNRWIDKYRSDVYIHGEDSVMMNGHKVRPPKYYDSQFEIYSPSDLELIKSERKRKALLHEFDNSPQRLSVREKVQLSRLRLLKRNLE